MNNYQNILLLLFLLIFIIFSSDAVAKKKQYSYIAASISNNFYQSAGKSNVPKGIADKVFSAFSYLVDFSSDLKENDKFEILYDTENKPVLLFASFTVNNQKISIYNYNDNYYTEDGFPASTILLKTPVNGAILSSQFGKRKHPIYGFLVPHIGIDFAVDLGTPLYAAGDGKVVFVGWNKGYGNYIKIKHGTIFSTAYGHVSRFAKGIKKGKMVKKGDIIAYVGNSGTSTGPHLHYEILENDKQVDPFNVPRTFVKNLSTHDIKLFNKNKSLIKTIVSKKHYK